MWDWRCQRTPSGGKDTRTKVSRKNTAESKRRRGEEDEGLSQQCQNVWREIFSEAGFEAAFKGIWSQAVPELRETSCTSLPKPIRVRETWQPNKILDSQTKQTCSRHTIGLHQNGKAIPRVDSFPARRLRRSGPPHTHKHSHSSCFRPWLRFEDVDKKPWSPSRVEAGWAEMIEVTTITAWALHSKSSLWALLILYASVSRSCGLRWVHSHSFSPSPIFHASECITPMQQKHSAQLPFRLETNVNGEIFALAFHKCV